MEMLERSKMAPVSVESHTGRGSTSAEHNAVTAALEQLARIQHLTLSVRGWPRFKEILSSLSGAAPPLHTFQIYYDSQARSQKP